MTVTELVGLTGFVAGFLFALLIVGSLAWLWYRRARGCGRQLEETARRLAVAAAPAKPPFTGSQAAPPVPHALPPERVA